jgi:pyruvate dehydrogenase E2 component (dihydrolipoamide acetyltransferase)
MADAVVLPKMGLTMEDGEVVEWFVAVGEQVEAGQALVEVSTYKANLDVEAPASGVLLAAVPPGTVVPAGAVIGVVGAVDEDVSDLPLGQVPGRGSATADAGEASDAPRPDAAPRPRPEPSARREGASVSPAARRRAVELGVDPAGLTGTGPNGKVRVEDVERAAVEGTAS